MKETIEAKWNEIMMLLETKYGISRILIETWIKPLSIYDNHDNTIYFCVDEKKGKHAVEYIKNKKYDVFLKKAISDVIADSNINVVVNFLEMIE